MTKRQTDALRIMLLCAVVLFALVLLAMGEPVNPVG